MTEKFNTVIVIKIQFNWQLSILVYKTDIRLLYTREVYAKSCLIVIYGTLVARPHSLSFYDNLCLLPPV